MALPKFGLRVTYSLFRTSSGRELVCVVFRGSGGRKMQKSFLQTGNYSKLIHPFYMALKQIIKNLFFCVMILIFFNNAHFVEFPSFVYVHTHLVIYTAIKHFSSSYSSVIWLLVCVFIFFYNFMCIFWVCVHVCLCVRETISLTIF